MVTSGSSGMTCRGAASAAATLAQSASSPRDTAVGSQSTISYPPRPRPEQVCAEHEAAPPEHLGKRERPVEQREPVGLPVIAGGIGDHRSGSGPGKQDPGLLEGLPHGCAHQRPGQLSRRVEYPAPFGAAGACPRDLLVGIPGIDGAAREDERSGGERHRWLAPEHVDLKAVFIALLAGRAVPGQPRWPRWPRWPQQHDGRGVPGGGRRHLTRQDVAGPAGQRPRQPDPSVIHGTFHDEPPAPFPRCANFRPA